MLKGTTYEIRMRSLPQERNCIRLMYPCLTIRECKVPGKNDGRVGDVQKSLNTEIGGEGMSLPPIAGQDGRRKRGRKKTRTWDCSRSTTWQAFPWATRFPMTACRTEVGTFLWCGYHRGRTNGWHTCRLSPIISKTRNIKAISEAR